MIDYKELLRKYIAHVLACEGVDFLGYANVDSKDFTKEEYEALSELRAK